MTFANNINRDQAPRNVGLDLRSILFDNQYQCLLKCGCFALDDLHSEDIEISSILQTVPDLLKGTVFLVNAMSD